MNARVVMHVEVDAGLCVQFHEQATRKHRVPDQVLGRLMRQYVLGSASEVGASSPRVAGDDRDLEELARQLHGWRSSPFGGD